MKSTSQVVLTAGSVALAVAAAFFFLFGSSSSSTSTPTDQTAGYSQSDVGKFPEGIENGGVGVRNYPVSMGSGVNQVAYRNTSGRTQYVTFGLFTTTGTASSTYNFVVGTSTSSSVGDYSSPNVQSNAALINFPIATSSLATTTNSIDGSGRSKGIVKLADGEYLTMALLQGFPSPSPLCTGATCETATSTNRGFNITGVITVMQP